LSRFVKDSNYRRSVLENHENIDSSFFKKLGFSYLVFTKLRRAAYTSTH
jgi:hypothetical protein